jgi:hypothetical protein
VKKKKGKRYDEKTIRDLLHAVEQWQLEEEKPGEGMLDEAKALAGEWVKGKRRLFDDNTSNPSTILLAALVVVFREYYELLEPVRRHYPLLFKQARSASAKATVGEVASYLKGADRGKLPQAARELAEIFWPSPRPLTREQKRKRKYEPKRYLRYGVGLIELEFGGAKGAFLRNPSVPFCLDEVLLGEPVTMIRLQELFGIARKQLVALHYKAFKHKLRPAEDGSYPWRAVLEIFEALLRPRRKRRIGRSRVSFPREAEKRDRLLRAIEVRLGSLGVRKQIQSLFLDVIRRCSTH